MFLLPFLDRSAERRPTRRFGVLAAFGAGLFGIAVLFIQLDAPFLATYGGQRAVAAQTEAYEGAVRLMASRDLEAFDLAKEKDTLREAYGRNAFGQGCLLARRLVENGVRFVEVSHGGWDMHATLDNRMKDVGADFDPDDPDNWTAE